jgi:hypothetical protein
LNSHRRSTWQFLTLIVTGSLLISTASLAGCDLLPVSESEAVKQTQIRETQLDINVKQTLMAHQQNDQIVQQTTQAQQVIQNAQATLLGPPGSPTNQPFQQPAPTIFNPPTPTTVPPAIQSAPPTPAPISSDQLAARMKTAKILLYEDMTTRLDTIRYIKPVLDKMGLSYKDDGAAKGWLRDDIANGPGGGKPWDLVIIAAEDKVGPAGEFFNYVLSSLDKGSSVIMETWFLDQSHGGLALGLMDRCGIAYDGNWVKIPPSRTVLFALDPSHPVLNEPNTNLSFSKSTAYWWDPNGKNSYDDGDLIKLLPGSSSKVLLGTIPESHDIHGTLTVCQDGQLILQTFSDHQFSIDSMSLLWENYIYNALRTRFEKYP